VLDAEAYQRLLDLAARADAEAGIRQGLVHGRSRPAKEFFNEFEAKHGLLYPRSPNPSACATKVGNQPQNRFWRRGRPSTRSW
jgi:hypothetical protein